MDSSQNQSSAQAAPDEQSQEQRVHYVRSFRRTLGVAAMYGLGHAVARTQIEENYQELSRVLRLGGRLDLAVADDSMIVNGHPVGPNDPHMQELAKTLNKMKLSDIGFRLGMTRREYGELFEVFIRATTRGGAPDVSGADLLCSKRLKHVQLQGGKYRRVADDQVIVDKRQGIAPSRHPGQSSPRPASTHRHDFEEWEREWKQQMKQGWNLGTDPSETDPGETERPTPSSAAGYISAPEPPSQKTPGPRPEPARRCPPGPNGSTGAKDEVTLTVSPPEAAQQVQALLAYLEGSPETAGRPPGEVFKHTHLDARQLGDLVLRAAVAELGSGNRGGEPFAEIVVTCLNRAVAGLKQAPGGSTQKGRRNVMQAVATLEEVVMEKLATLSIPDEEREAVAGSAKAARNQLRLEGLAAEYAKRRQAMDQSEKRIMRMLRAKDVDNAQKTELHDLLADAGMDPEGWDNLVARTQRTRPRKIDADSASDADALVQRLEALAALMEHTGAPAEETRGPDLEGAVSEVDLEIRRIAWETDLKIQTLRSEQDGGSGKRNSGPSKRRILAGVADVARVLRQPMQVVACSNDLLLKGCVGEVSDDQRQLLDLARHSIARMGDLMVKLESLDDRPGPGEGIAEAGPTTEAGSGR